MDFKGKNIHFVGVGGVSMRCLARFCLWEGMMVSGSDAVSSEAVENLRTAGVHILPPSETDFISECDLVVYSAAVPPDNPQLLAARTALIPTLERKAFLGLMSRLFDRTVAISGTHGKTTVTAMICAIFRRAGMSFTGHIGGELAGRESGLILHGKEWFVTEACEYSRSFLTLAPYVTAVLNLQYDHPDCYKDYGDMKEAYDKLIENTSANGCVVCEKSLEHHLNLNGRRVVTFGYTRDADVYPEEVTYSGGKYTFWLSRCGIKRAQLHLQVQGKHNIANALAAYAVASECGVGDIDCAAALGAFYGVKGRYEHKGVTLKGAAIVYDYAHHPGEIEVAIDTARQSVKGKVEVVFEPHTFSRTRALMKEFVSALSLADEVIVLPTYKAREKYTPAGSGYDLYMHIKVHENVKCAYAPDYKKAAETAFERTSAGDIILILGAGSVWRTADML